MAKTSAIVFGIIFVVAGIWGLFSDAAIGFIGAGDYVSSIIHIILGLVLLVVAGKSSAGTALKTVGIIYVILAILAFIGAAFIPDDSTTNIFYLIVGIVVALLGFASKKSVAAPAQM